MWRPLDRLLYEGLEVAFGAESAHPHKAGAVVDRLAAQYALEFPNNNGPATAVTVPAPTHQEMI